MPTSDDIIEMNYYVSSNNQAYGPKTLQSSIYILQITYIIILPDVIIYVLLRPYFFSFPFIAILKTCKVRGTEPIFSLLVRSADPADRGCDRQTDGQAGRHNKGARGLLVLNTLKVSSGFIQLYVCLYHDAFNCVIVYHFFWEITICK